VIRPACSLAKYTLANEFEYHYDHLVHQSRYGPTYFGEGEHYEASNITKQAIYIYPSYAHQHYQ